ncbi:MAG: nucleoside-diphosphate kinase [Myxococcales bacterium]|nr:nucleoside-diphosphate kinase [Myxococcales bacterium]
MRRAKHLIQIEGRSILSRAAGALLGSSAEEVVVVLAPGDREGVSALGALELRGVRVVFAESPDEGRAASVRAGVRATAPGAAGLLIALADQPFLEAADFDALIRAFGAGAGGIVHAAYAGERGTPVLFAARYREELLALRGREGGRVVILRHPGEVCAVALDPARGRDLDRPEDLLVSRSMQRTLSIIKPDAIAAGKLGGILQHIEDAGLRIVAMRMLHLTPERAQEFYAVHRERPFYQGLVAFMSSGPVVVSVLEGPDAIAHYRTVMGATNPEEAEAGTIRKLYATDVERNACHGSDGPETAQEEIAFFF